MDYDGEFKKLNEFKHKQNEQKKRGLNNYNILTAVLNEHDEVRLHSNMLFSFLDPKGEHFQDTLFLDKFIDVIKAESLGFEVNIQNCSVYKEYRNIDLYITDGDKHIIIENKIYASDQENQVVRYLKIIQEENSKASVMDILLVYLSLDRRKPSQYSLNEFTINGDYVESLSGKKQALYKSISYQKEIIDWLDSCQHEVQNITNLNAALGDYKNVIDKLNNNYQEKVMSLSEYILKDKSSYELAFELKNNLPKAQEKIANDFFESLRKALFDELKRVQKDDWVIDEIPHNIITGKGASYPIIINKKSWKSTNNTNHFSVYFAIEGTSYFIGISCDSPEQLDIQNDIIEKYKHLLEPESLSNANSNKWWVCYRFVDVLRKKDQDAFIHYLHTEDKAVETIKFQMMKMINDFEINSGFLSAVNSRDKNL
ncbi:MAG: PD-(D/E)XK nuclease family protein [Paraglaciecola sp.]|uniref:PDDEXK-like family protein n=1 Tax=Paraglaciecola sp. TaxID=1920173 RepID=UPI003296D196